MISKNCEKKDWLMFFIHFTRTVVRYVFFLVSSSPRKIIGLLLSKWSPGDRLISESEVTWRHLWRTHATKFRVFRSKMVFYLSFAIWYEVGCNCMTFVCSILFKKHEVDTWISKSPTTLSQSEVVRKSEFPL